MAYLKEVKLKNGKSWQLFYYEHGKRQTIYLPNLTKAQALLEKNRIEHILKLRESEKAVGKIKAEFGIEVQSNIDLSDFYKMYQDSRSQEVEKNTLAAPTLKRQLYALRLFRDMFPGRLISSVTPRDLEDFKSSRAKVISASGVNKDLLNLRVALRWAHRKGLLPVPIYDRVEFFKVEKRLPDFFEPHQIDEIEQYVAPDTALFAFRLIKYSGIRRTEVTKITWGDVKENYIILPHTKTRLQRTIPLHDKLREVLEERNQICSFKSDDRLVPMHPDTLTHYFKRAVDMAGYSGYRRAVHVLRHSLGAYMASKGFNLNQIAQMLGHETMTMARLYGQIPKADLKNMMNDLWSKK